MYIGRNLSLPSMAVLRSGARSIDLTTGTLLAGATLTRSTTATRFNASGVLETVAIDGARFDYDPLTLALRGLLIEPARTNQFVQSQNLATGWGFVGASAPSATRLIENSANSNHFARQFITAAIGDTVTIAATAWEIPGSAKRYLNFTSVALANQLAVFDLAAGTVDVANCTATITRIGTIGGTPVWRCTATFTATAAGSLGNVLQLVTSPSASSPVRLYQGDGVSGLNITDMQYEIGGAASSIIPTTTVAVTRAADVAVLPGTALGLGDGVFTLRYSFDNGTTQDVASTISGGSWTVPATLNRRWIRAIALG